MPQDNVQSINCNMVQAILNEFNADNSLDLDSQQVIQNIRNLCDGQAQVNVDQINACIAQHQWNTGEEVAVDICLASMMAAIAVPDDFCLKETPEEIGKLLSILKEYELLNLQNLSKVTANGGQYVKESVRTLKALQNAKDRELQEAKLFDFGDMQANFYTITKVACDKLFEAAIHLSFLKLAGLLAGVHAQAIRNAIVCGGGQYTRDIGRLLFFLHSIHLLNGEQIPKNCAAITCEGGKYAENIYSAIYGLLRVRLHSKVHPHTIFHLITSGGGKYTKQIGASLLYLYVGKLLDGKFAQANHALITRWGAQNAENILLVFLRLFRGRVLTQVSLNSLAEGGAGMASLINSIYEKIDSEEEKLLCLKMLLGINLYAESEVALAVLSKEFRRCSKIEQEMIAKDESEQLLGEATNQRQVAEDALIVKQKEITNNNESKRLGEQKIFKEVLGLFNLELDTLISTTKSKESLAKYVDNISFAHVLSDTVKLCSYFTDTPEGLPDTVRQFIFQSLVANQPAQINQLRDCVEEYDKCYAQYCIKEVDQLLDDGNQYYRDNGLLDESILPSFLGSFEECAENLSGIYLRASKVTSVERFSDGRVDFFGAKRAHDNSSGEPSLKKARI